MKSWFLVIYVKRRMADDKDGILCGRPSGMPNWRKFRRRRLNAPTSVLRHADGWNAATTSTLLRRGQLDGNGRYNWLLA